MIVLRIFEQQRSNDLYNAKFVKSFDTVDSGVLVKKYIAYGLRGDREKFISSYLKNQLQYVV